LLSRRTEERGGEEGEGKEGKWKEGNEGKKGGGKDKAPGFLLVLQAAKFKHSFLLTPVCYYCFHAKNQGYFPLLPGTGCRGTSGTISRLGSSAVKDKTSRFPYMLPRVQMIDSRGGLVAENRKPPMLIQEQGLCGMDTGKRYPEYTRKGSLLPSETSMSHLSTPQPLWSLGSTVPSPSHSTGLPPLVKIPEWNLPNLRRFGSLSPNSVWRESEYSLMPSQLTRHLGCGEQ
jgi:hypothetical protein